MSHETIRSSHDDAVHFQEAISTARLSSDRLSSNHITLLGKLGLLRCRDGTLIRVTFPSLLAAPLVHYPEANRVRCESMQDKA